MKCTIAGPNIKTFAKIVHAFAKIGDDIYFEPFEEGLQLKAVNSSRSAYFCVTLMVPFFQHFASNYNETSVGNDNAKNQKFTPPCKLTLKSVLLIFKSLASLEKQHIEYFKLILNPYRNKAIFKVYCKYGILKSYHLSYMECDSIEAIIPETNLDSDEETSQIHKEINFQNNLNLVNSFDVINTQSQMHVAKFKSNPKLLQELVSQFSSTVEEITFQVCPDMLTVKNYQPQDELLIDSSLNANTQEVSKKIGNTSSQNSISTINHSKRTLDTEVKFYPGEFLSYRFNNNNLSNSKSVDVTFCVKEFKAALSFLEYVEADITFRIDSPGKPLLLKSKIEHFYTATFLMATLAEMIVEEGLSPNNLSQINCENNNGKINNINKKQTEKTHEASNETNSKSKKENQASNKILILNEIENDMEDDMYDNEISQIYPSSNTELKNIPQNVISNQYSLLPLNQNSQYFHESPINFAKSLSNKNCLILASDSDEN